MNTDKPGSPYYQLSVDETLTSTNSAPEGISSAEAAARLQQYGENALPQKAGKPAWLRFLAHFNDVLIYVLLAAALLTAVMGHWVDTLVILGVAVINALIGHIQESNAEKSLQSIRNMLSSEAVVIRQGNHETIPTTALVPGDIVVIRAGDRIPADLRVIEAHNLRVEEAILTGESTVVEKNTDALSGELPLGDRTNLLFSGTTVSSGGGKGLVVATGGNTELGHINQMMADIEKHRTPLLVQMDKLGKAIFIIILVMMAALFVFSLLFRDMPVSELMLSLISLAVASVPEGLPAIISIILSLGVQTMAIPTSACFSAGASFTPSPVIPTTSFLLCSAWTRRNLSSGLVRAKISNFCAASLNWISSITSSSRPVMALPALPIPSILPILIAVCGWSPVIIFTRIPACRQSPIAVIASGRGGSIIPAIPSKITPCCRS